MLLNRKNNYGIIHISILIVGFFCMTHHVIADDDLNQLGKNIKNSLRSLGIPQSEESKTNQKNLSEVIQAFKEALSSEDEETKVILKQWDNYIVGITHFSNDEHFVAIGAQRTDYLNALHDLNDRLLKIDAAEKKYSSEWVNDLITNCIFSLKRMNYHEILTCQRHVKILTTLQATLIIPNKRYPSPQRHADHIATLLKKAFATVSGLNWLEAVSFTALAVGWLPGL